MDAYVIVALIAVALLLAEAVLPTGGAIGAIGVLGFFAAGIVALINGGKDADWREVARVAVITVNGQVRPAPEQRPPAGFLWGDPDRQRFGLGGRLKLTVAGAEVNLECRVGDGRAFLEAFDRTRALRSAS